MPTEPSSEPQAAKDAVPETRPPSAASLPTTPPDSEVPAELALQPGGRPLPDYELIRKLGAGGFGEVWQARGPGGLDVALKFIRLDARGSALELRSLEVMKSIRHPNLVGLFGAWQRERLLILAMELCDRSLHDRLKEALAQNLPGIPTKELLNYMRDAAHGVDVLNEHHVQHRDIKPANLLLLQRGVKVADFGLAKVLEGSVGGHTGAMTPAYATPECFKGAISRHSDQYSLAMTYYHLRTGRPLFTGTLEYVMYCHMQATPDLGALPPAERAALARALAKDPEERWRNCKTFVNELIKACAADVARPKREDKPPVPDVEPVTVLPADLKPAVVRPIDRPPAARATPRPAPKAPPPPGRPTDRIKRPQPAPAPSRRRRAVLSGFLFVLLVLLAVAALGVAFGVYPADVARFVSGWWGGAAPKPPEPYENALGMRFVWVAPGKFVMGSPADPPEPGRFDDETPHPVTLTRGFYISAHPVTQKQWRAVMKANPSHFQGDDLPVENVSWDDCQEFVKKLQASDGRPYRLPTEAEWEYGCRAGTTTAYWFGDDAAKLGEHAWFAGNSGDRTHPVGTRRANAWWLHDLHGNVRLWCEDYYGPYDGLPENDPVRSERYGDGLRVVRNGSWRGDAANCRAAYRYRLRPGYRDANLGCRLVFRPE